MATTLTPISTDPPREAWALGWSFLVGQLLTLAEQDGTTNDGFAVVISMLLGAVVVTWFSRGVLTGRRGRTIVVTVLLALTVVLGVASVVDGSGWDLVQCAMAILQLTALVAFLRTDYARARRAESRPSRDGLGGVLLLAVLVGVLGGMVGSSSVDDTVQVGVRL